MLKSEFMELVVFRTNKSTRYFYLFNCINKRSKDHKSFTTLFSLHKPLVTRFALFFTRCNSLVTRSTFLIIRYTLVASTCLERDSAR